MTDKLSGCAALVTGASSGIGQATAAELASLGAHVVAVARRKDRLDELVAGIEAAGGSASAIVADITEESAAQDVVAQTVQRHGRLDILVNNAGVMLLGPSAEASLEDWKRMVDLNVLGLLYCTHAALPHLIEAAGNGPRRVSDLVNVSSIGGRSVRPGSQVYNLTKWGVGALSESMRQELAAKHVRVSVIEPGATRTELQEANRPEILAQIRGRQDGFELLDAQDLADAIGYMVTRPRHVNVNEIMVRPTEIA
ncbi:SDR family NAD(P)-dependent oxidoreductase [Actinospica sp. MGRD01-02]|uniref:SDR family NAD(P)-dependent oxidoreductase n=1 Tax=Actinospica acidithermotolerans TaxID=2828514 RepID=A0A941ECD3_9ACTN|nr:SDR family NAD(P)-dependent oxidoreductase [Actinospica acidithermotolerans]MBR7825274.1 SDR family NAD(P)-dependent oxidoreductase [Actinospica acidithermotolerans]